MLELQAQRCPKISSSHKKVEGQPPERRGKGKKQVREIMRNKIPGAK